MEIHTSFGNAKADIDDQGQARFMLVMTHGAGGGVASADLLAARKAGLDAGAVVARVIQPYRLAGRSTPSSPQRQDAAWLEIIATLRSGYPDLPLVQGGRSNGARVACRTAGQAQAVGVVALAFPLHPPGKADEPERSRAPELRSAGVPVLVVNGDRDPFGVPNAADVDRLVVLPGETHALSRRPDAITAAVAAWLSDLTGRIRSRSRVVGRRAPGSLVVIAPLPDEKPDPKAQIDEQKNCPRPPCIRIEAENVSLGMDGPVSDDGEHEGADATANPDSGQNASSRLRGQKIDLVSGFAPALTVQARSTRASMALSTRSRKESTTASLYSGPSSRWTSAAARRSSRDTGELLMPRL